MRRKELCGQDSADDCVALDLQKMFAKRYGYGLGTVGGADFRVERHFMLSDYTAAYAE